VIRGGTGIYFASPVSNVTFSPQLYSQLVSAQFVFDGRSDFITNPTNGLTTADIFSGKIKLPAQTVRSNRTGLQVAVQLAEQHRLPEADQRGDRLSTSISRTGPSTAIRALWMQTWSTTRPPVTTWRRARTRSVPIPRMDRCSSSPSDGKRDQTAISSSLTRRLKTASRLASPGQLMPGDEGQRHGRATARRRRTTRSNYLSGEWGDVAGLPAQHHPDLGADAAADGDQTRACPTSMDLGNRFADSIATAPYGKTGTNRLNLAGNGGPEPAITIPASVLDIAGTAPP